MFKKLGQKNDFSRSYDDKRGQKSLKITKNLKNLRQSKNLFLIFFVLNNFFLYESTKNKI